MAAGNVCRLQVHRGQGAADEDGDFGEKAGEERIDLQLQYVDVKVKQGKAPETQQRGGMMAPLNEKVSPYVCPAADITCRVE